MAMTGVPEPSPDWWRNAPRRKRQPEPGHSGARMVWMVTMKLRPVRIVEKPLMKMPMTRA